MPGAVGNNCVYCHKVFVANSRAKSLAILPPNAGSCEKNYLQIINYLLPHLSSLFPNFQQLSSANNLKGHESRFVCVECSKALVEAYKGVEALERLKSGDSLISSHAKNRTAAAHHEEKEVQTQMTMGTMVEQLDRPKAKVPEVTKIKDMWRNSRKRTVILNKVKMEAQNELKRFARVSKVLKTEDVGNEDPNFAKRDKELEKELEDLCPTLLELIYGLFSRTPRYKEFTPLIRTAVAIATFNLTSKCNAFQRNVSFKMYENNAPVKLYGLFNELRLCMSYKRTCQLLDSFLKKDEEKAEKGDDAADEDVELSMEDQERVEENETESELEETATNDNHDGSEDEELMDLEDPLKH